MRGIKVLSAVLLLVAGTAPVLAQGTGRIEGEIVRPNGKGLGGVTVVLSELGSVEITNNEGRFVFEGVPEGSYTVSFTLGDNTDSQEVTVTSGATTQVDQQVDWDVSFAEEITIFSASRRRERIVEAPAAVTVITEQQIEREAAHGQLPKLLEFTPGAEVTQSGLYDFNFNARGFNSSLNRRILTLIDGRDPSVIFLGSQEWTSLALPLDSLASVELVRGPGSALYGADAYNGVVNMTTKTPRETVGGRATLSGGELSTVRGDLSVAGELGNDWYGRVVGGYLEGDDFAQSRVDRNGNGVPDVGTEVEYPGLGLERQPLVRDRNEAYWGNLRLDKYFDRGHTFTLEAGYSDFEAGGVAVTGIGRVQTTDSVRPYLRLNYNTQHWNFLAYRNERDADDTRSLSTGIPLYLDSDKTHFEVQGHSGFAGGRGRVIGGVSYSEESFDSENPQGSQTLVFEPIDTDYEGVFGQLEYDFNAKLRGVLSARWDDSNLYDSQFSPRAALVFSPDPDHSFRVSYGEAFQSPNYSEFFLQVPVAGAIPLNLLLLPAFGFDVEAVFCAANGISCGLDAVPVLALGNPELEVEQVESFEIGYSGILGKRAYLTVDYYNNQLDNFITDLIPAANPALGILNPAFGPYVAPDAIPEPFRSILEGAVRSALPTASNDPVTGEAILKALTYTNFGQVDTQGVEVGLNAHLTDEWLLNVTYNWFDFDVKEQLEPDQLLPNAPENQYGLGISYVGDVFDVAVKYRHVDSFDWAAGVFAGPIPAYDVVDLTANYQVNDRVEVGVNVTNLFDDNHYQIFGGDVLERRALGHVSFRW